MSIVYYSIRNDGRVQEISKYETSFIKEWNMRFARSVGGIKENPDYSVRWGGKGLIEKDKEAERKSKVELCTTKLFAQTLTSSQLLIWFIS